MACRLNYDKKKVIVNSEEVTCRKGFALILYKPLRGFLQSHSSLLLLTYYLSKFSSFNLLNFDLSLFSFSVIVYSGRYERRSGLCSLVTAATVTGFSSSSLFLFSQAITDAATRIQTTVAAIRTTTAAAVVAVATE